MEVTETTVVRVLLSASAAEARGAVLKRRKNKAEMRNVVGRSILVGLVGVSWICPIGQVGVTESA